MGSPQCQCTHNAQQELLQQQLALYRWRSDHRHNAFLPRVTLKHGPIATHHRFQQFLQQHQGAHTLDLQAFRDGEGAEGGEVLVFERYVCTLEDINGLLSLPETVYALSALVAAYSLLNKAFKEVVVSRSCCFVTREGQIRGWINCDPKNNFVDSALETPLQERNYRGIAYKILSEACKCSEPAPSTLALFALLRHTVERSEARNDLFEIMRETISQYAGLNQLPLCQSIEEALRRKQRASERSSSAAKGSVGVGVETVLNDTRLSGWGGEGDRSHMKSKSVESTTLGSLIIRNSLALQHNQPLLHPTQSQLEQQQPSRFAARGEDQSTPPILKRKLVKMPESLEKTEKPRALMKLSEGQPGNASIIKLSQTSKQRTPSDSLKVSVEPDPLLSGTLFTEKEVGNLVDKVALKCGPRRSKQRNVGNVERKISIMDFSEEAAHPKTCHEVVSGGSLGGEQERQPWKTNKTITRLITDNADSLVHSEGTSSEYSGSLYSGVLTHMGRDVTHKQLSSQHSQPSSR